MMLLLLHMMMLLLHMKLFLLLLHVMVVLLLLMIIAARHVLVVMLVQDRLPANFFVVDLLIVGRVGVVVNVGHGTVGPETTRLRQDRSRNRGFDLGSASQYYLTGELIVMILN